STQQADNFIVEFQLAIVAILIGGQRRRQRCRATRVERRKQSALQSFPGEQRMIDVQVRQPASAFGDLLFSQLEIAKMIEYARPQSERLPNVRTQSFNRALGLLQAFGIVAYRPERFDTGSAFLFGQMPRRQSI